MNILHLVLDEKFIDFFSGIVSTIPDTRHRYIVYTPQPDKPLRHIRSITPYRIVSDDYFTSRHQQDDLQNCDVLLVHFMTPMAAKMILQAPPAVKIVWSGWGADYYHLLPGGDHALLSPETAQIARRQEIRKAFRHPLALARLMLGQLRQRYLKNHLLLPAIRRVHLFSAPLPGDYDLLTQALGTQFTARYAQLNYGSVEDTFAMGNTTLNGCDILVGNSASFSNNHVEIFRLLAQHDLSGRKVVVPLSYGDTNYRDTVLLYGKTILGTHFDPIVDFMPLAEYNTHISRCAVVIMNHQRQQALGNIGTLLYQGAKLFLDRRNIVFSFLSQRGAHIYSTDQLQDSSESVFTALTEQQRQDNRRVLQNFWGREVVTANAAKFIEILRTLNA